MERARGSIAAILAATALAAAGCCGLHGYSHLNRDTPEAAFDFVRAAFAEDRTLDQYDSFHPAFREAQGISAGKYGLARNLRPGLFEKARRIVGEATLESVERGPEPFDFGKGPRGWARVRIRTREGRGVFLLVDEPSWFLSTDDEELGPVRGPVEDVGRSVRVEGSTLVVELRATLPFPPEPGKQVRRLEIHHDWMLYAVEELEGFDEFLGEVRKTEEETGKDGKKGNPQ
jgi:hypothetical protein